MAREELQFRIGDAFPADKPLARWLTVLAMASNDVFRMFHWLDSAETVGAQLLAYRIQAAAVFEAALHLSETIRHVPEVKSFYEQLPDEAREVGDRVIAAVDRSSEHYIGEWAEPHRNVTFHYPEMHPAKAEHGQEEIKNALARAADLRGAISVDGTFGSLRFEFADEVAVQFLPEGTPENAPAVEAVRDTGMALATFVQHAANAYLAQLAEGTVQRTQ